MSKIKSGMKSLFTIAKNAVEGVDQSVPKEVQEKRLVECEKCPMLMITGNCKSCGCFVKAKTKFKQEYCPEGRWSKWESN